MTSFISFALVCNYKSMLLKTLDSPSLHDVITQSQTNAVRPVSISGKISIIKNLVF